MDIRTNIFNEDCIKGMPRHLKPDSVHLTVTSIPFEELFTYSGKPEDVGNNGSTVDISKGRFALNMQFVIEQLLRVIAPGCNVCIHIQQLLAYKNQHGYMGRRDFRGAMIEAFTAATPARPEPFRFVGEVAITKDPQAMAQRLSLHSLQFATGYRRTSTNWAPAPNDYVLIFQKPGVAATPVRPLIYRQTSGLDPLPMWRTEFFASTDDPSAMAYAAYLQSWAREKKAANPRLDVNPLGWMVPGDWVKWAHGCWDDIDEFDIIDGARSKIEKQKMKEADEEKHVCPLQLEVVRRLILMYSNPAAIQPDVLVLDPFMGVGSTAAVAVELGRHAVGFELKESYHANALRNVERARRQVERRQWVSEQPGLFADQKQQQQPEPEEALPAEIGAQR